MGYRYIYLILLNETFEWNFKFHFTPNPQLPTNGNTVLNWIGKVSGNSQSRFSFLYVNVWQDLLSCQATCYGSAKWACYDLLIGQSDGLSEVFSKDIYKHVRSDLSFERKSKIMRYFLYPADLYELRVLLNLIKYFSLPTFNIQFFVVGNSLQMLSGLNYDEKEESIDHCLISAPETP